MPSADILRTVAIERTPRVMQLEGMFDLATAKVSESKWSVHLDPPAEWNVGLIVGASGSGKSTVAKEFFGKNMVSGHKWPENKAIVDAFPAKCGIKDVTELLSSVGFSSPPSWLRPFRVLSNGEQFRVTIARALAEQPDLLVFDEFTSVVDRNVAKVASAAIAKCVRRRKQKFIAVSCHHDIIEWLQPDWIYEPAADHLTVSRGELRRPKIELEIFRVHYQAWSLFRKHHYLNTDLNRAAACYVALWQGVPVAFSAWLPLASGTVQAGYREHRTVTLPDYQGVGIGNAISGCLASMWRGLGKRVFSATSHPSMTFARERSPLWRVTRPIQLARRENRRDEPNCKRINTRRTG